MYPLKSQNVLSHSDFSILFNGVSESRRQKLRATIHSPMFATNSHVTVSFPREAASCVVTPSDVMYGYTKRHKNFFMHQPCTIGAGESYLV